MCLLKKLLIGSFSLDHLCFFKPRSRSKQNFGRFFICKFSDKFESIWNRPHFQAHHSPDAATRLQRPLEPHLLQEDPDSEAHVSPTTRPVSTADSVTGHRPRSRRMVRRHRSATARRRPCSVPRRLTARLVAEEASGEEAAVAEEVLLAVVDSETAEVRSTHYFGLRKFVHAPLRSGSLIILFSDLTFRCLDG